jgi:hypothetical protein
MACDDKAGKKQKQDNNQAGDTLCRQHREKNIIFRDVSHAVS